MIKCFDFRHTTDIFYRSIVHIFLRGLIVVHFFFGTPIKTKELHHKGQDNSKKRNDTIPPVNGQQKNYQGEWGHQRSNKIRELMRDKFFNALNVLVHNLPHPTAANGQMIP